MLSEKNTKLLQKAWINVYSSTLTDEQVCRLAARHNLDNTGSRPTKWIERVNACRQWLYEMMKTDKEDETPASTMAWKKVCHNMYMQTGKVMYSSHFNFQSVFHLDDHQHIVRKEANCLFN